MAPNSQCSGRPVLHQDGLYCTHHRHPPISRTYLPHPVHCGLPALPLNNTESPQYIIYSWRFRLTHLTASDAFGTWDRIGYSGRLTRASQCPKHQTPQDTNVGASGACLTAQDSTMKVFAAPLMYLICLLSLSEFADDSANCSDTYARFPDSV